jgi:hypothetical protein
VPVDLAAARLAVALLCGCWEQKRSHSVTAEEWQKGSRPRPYHSRLSRNQPPRSQDLLKARDAWFRLRQHHVTSRKQSSQPAPSLIRLPRDYTHSQSIKAIQVHRPCCLAAASCLARTQCMNRSVHGYVAI